MKFFHSVLFVLLALLSHSSRSKELILMAVGEQTNIHSPSFENISLSRGDIIKIHEREDSLILSAKKPGTVFLNHGSKIKIIKVLEKYEKQSWLEFIKAISKNPWLKWNFSEDKIHISGQLHFFQTWQNLADISQKIPHSLLYGS